MFTREAVGEREASHRKHDGGRGNRRELASHDAPGAHAAICRASPHDAPKQRREVEQRRCWNRRNVAGCRPRQRVHELDAIAHVVREGLDAKRMLPGGHAPCRIGERPRGGAEVGPCVGRARLR